MDTNSKQPIQKKAQRTFMPEIIAPGTGLSPLTQKSVIPTNNVVTIQDILNGKKYNLPGGGGDWSSGHGEDVSKSFREDGDAYKRKERDLEILNKMITPSQREPQKWKIRVPGGTYVRDSFELATQLKRELQNKGVKTVWVSRIAQGPTRSRVEVVSDALSKTFMVESFDIYKGVKEVGSAFCVAENTFVTCAHVIKKYNKNAEKGLDSNQISGMIKIFLVQNGKRFDAELVSFNPTWDIAILKSKVNANKFDIDTQVNVGEDILAVGSPHGFENNVTFGTIGSLDKTIYSYKEAPKYMFVDLSAFPGNSGGPIIKVSNGKIVGMLTAIVSSKGDYGLNAGLPSYYIERYCIMEGVIK
jgi:S1-C subfamily serine protease